MLPLISKNGATTGIPEIATTSLGNGSDTLSPVAALDLTSYACCPCDTIIFEWPIYLVSLLLEDWEGASNGRDY